MNRAWLSKRSRCCEKCGINKKGWSFGEIFRHILVDKNKHIAYFIVCGDMFDKKLLPVRVEMPSMMLIMNSARKFFTILWLGWKELCFELRQVWQVFVWLQFQVRKPGYTKIELRHCKYRYINNGSYDDEKTVTENSSYLFASFSITSETLQYGSLVIAAWQAFKNFATLTKCCEEMGEWLMWGLMSWNLIEFGSLFARAPQSLW